MCGIAGFKGFADDPASAETLLSRMIMRVRHRGPDGQETWTDQDVGFAHARLSIIDLASGTQPMTNAAGDVCITFNGEIFNYVELRQELAAEGYRFRTTSDTEVIIALYERDGIDVVQSLNGDFAFVIWDRRRRRLLMARDRMGVRPLHYAVKDRAIAFASEVKSLLALPAISADIDPVALSQIFTTWAPLPPRTAFKGVKELPPGHLLVWENDAATVKPYWRLQFPDAADDRVPGDAEAGRLRDELLDLLVDATRIRLRADVPIGSYLSGGFDSSFVSALARREVSDRLRTFSVTFENPEFDESAEQQAMVAALGTDHTSVLCRARDIGDFFPKVIEHTERPILRTAPAPLYRLAQTVRESGYKVVLTGEGADEVFAGYDVFKEAKIRSFCARQPDSAFRPLLLRKLYPYLPAFRGQPQRYLESFFGVGSNDADDPLSALVPRFKSTAGAKDFFSRDLRDAIGAYDPLADMRDGLPADFMRWHPLNQAQYLETTHLLPNYILCSQGDRMAMAHGVEGRFPFLDHRVVEFASKLPTTLKLKVLREKHILRECARGLLPDAIAERTKQPYRAPDSQSFVGDAEPAYIPDLLSEQSIRQDGLFDPSAVRMLHQKCRGGRFVGNRQNTAFVGIVSTLLWRRSFQTPARMPAAQLETSPS